MFHRFHRFPQRSASRAMLVLKPVSSPELRQNTSGPVDDFSCLSKRWCNPCNLSTTSLWAVKTSWMKGCNRRLGGTLKSAVRGGRGPDTPLPPQTPPHLDPRGHGLWTWISGEKQYFGGSDSQFWKWSIRLGGGVDDLQGSHREKKRKVRFLLLYYLVPCCCTGNLNVKGLGMQPCRKSQRRVLITLIQMVTSASLFQGGRVVPFPFLTDGTVNSW